MLGYISSGKDGDMSLKFGLMALDEFEEYHVHTETTRIPLFPIESHPEFRFGYTLRYADEQVFSSYFVLTLPSPPKVIQGGLMDAARSDNDRVLTSVPIIYQGEAIETLAFNESDPPGRWQIDIYVNEAFVRSIRFTVIHPPKS
jgi:hypothetical protein